MAEVEGPVEAIEEAKSGIDEQAAGEASEKMGSEEQAEIKEVVEKSQAEVKELSKTARVFKEMRSSSVKVLKSFGIFVAKNSAIAAIFAGVTVLLTKLIHQTGGEGQQQKQSRRKTLAVVQAIVNLIKAENKMCDTIKDWLQKHKDDTITLGDFVLKMEAIFEEKLDPISVAITKAYDVSRPLMTKKVNGNHQWNIPKEGDIHKLLSASDALIKAFGNLRDFAEEHKKKLVVLKSLLDILTQESLGELQSKMDAIKDMPFE